MPTTSTVMGMPIRIRVARMKLGSWRRPASAVPIERMNASLVSVAPEMMSTLALCALTASSRSRGSA